jgi:hypothetical protein
MKRKIESGRDLRQTVQCVNHPGLDAQHRLFLTVLVDFADHGAGANARPGYEFLASAVGKTVESVRLYARHCESLGLIKLTHLAHGKGNANVFAFCLDHPAYPDNYPGYKPKLAPNARTVSPKRESGLPQTEGELAPNVGLDPQKPLHKTTYNTPPRANAQPTNPAAYEPVVVDVVNTERRSNAVNELVKRFVDKEGTGPKKFSRLQKTAMVELVSLHGEKNFLDAGAAWLRANPWDAKTESHFAAFVNNFVVYLKLAEHAQKEVDREVQFKIASDQATENHLRWTRMFGVGDYFDKTILSSAELERFNAVREQPWGSWSEADEEFCHDISVRLGEEATRKRAAERGEAEDAINDLLGVVVDDGTPPF